MSHEDVSNGLSLHSQSSDRLEWVFGKFNCLGARDFYPYASSTELYEAAGPRPFGILNGVLNTRLT